MDDIVTRTPRLPEFSGAGLLDYMVELVVVEDKVSKQCCQCSMGCDLLIFIFM